MRKIGTLALLLTLGAALVLFGCNENKTAKKDKPPVKEGPIGSLADVGTTDRILCSHYIVDASAKKKYWAVEELDFEGNVVRSYTNAETNLQGVQNPSYNATGQYIVYSANLGLGWDMLWQKAEDGTKPNRMTEANDNVSPQFVPSGRSIVLLVITKKGSRDGKLMNFIMERGTAETITYTNTDQNPKISCDGKWVVFDRGEKGGRQIYLTRLDSSRLIKLTDGAGDHVNPSISRDGKQVAYELRSGKASTIHIVNIDRTGDRELGPGASPTFSPDGQWVAAAPADTKNGTAMIYPLAKGESRKLMITEPTNLVSKVSWSPAGDKAAATDATGHVFIINAEDGKKLGQSKDGNYQDLLFSPATSGELVINSFGQKLIDKNKVTAAAAAADENAEAGKATQ